MTKKQRTYEFIKFEHCDAQVGVIECLDEAVIKIAVGDTINAKLISTFPITMKSEIDMSVIDSTSMMVCVGCEKYIIITALQDGATLFISVDTDFKGYEPDIKLTMIFKDHMLVNSTMVKYSQDDGKCTISY